MSHNCLPTRTHEAYAKANIRLEELLKEVDNDTPVKNSQFPPLLDRAGSPERKKFKSLQIKNRSASVVGKYLIALKTLG